MGESNAYDALAMCDLNPMSEAPRERSEILAYHKEGKNFHPVYWTDHTWMDGETEHWSMRWCGDYRQYDCDYAGWLPYPVLGVKQLKDGE